MEKRPTAAEVAEELIKRQERRDRVNSHTLPTHDHPSGAEDLYKNHTSKGTPLKRSTAESERLLKLTK